MTEAPFRWDMCSASPSTLWLLLVATNSQARRVLSLCHRVTGGLKSVLYSSPSELKDALRGNWVASEKRREQISL